MVSVSSGIVSYEISRASDEERKRCLYSAVRRASEYVPVGQETYVRAGELQHRLGIRAYDALHIACAEQGGADVFLSTDDKLVKAAKRNRAEKSRDDDLSYNPVDIAEGSGEIS